MARFGLMVLVRNLMILVGGCGFLGSVLSVLVMDLMSVWLGTGCLVSELSYLSASWRVVLRVAWQLPTWFF